MQQQRAYAVTCYNELVHVLRNPTTFISGNGISMIDDVNALLKGSTVNSVGDEHKSCRRVTTRPLMPKEIKHLNNISTKRVKHWGIVGWTNRHLMPELRDPCLFYDEGQLWLLYSGDGERGIGVAEMVGF